MTIELAVEPPPSLQTLLEKNCTEEGLTEEEEQQAWNLIYTPVFSDNYCWLCTGMLKREPTEDRKSIYDTGLCQGHAQYALVTRK